VREGLVNNRGGDLLKDALLRKGGLHRKKKCSMRGPGERLRSLLHPVRGTGEGDGGSSPAEKQTECNGVKGPQRGKASCPSQET